MLSRLVHAGRVRHVHPGIELEVADVLSEPCIERVRSGQADFALAATRADTPELRAEPFCRDDFHLVCRRDHPLVADPHVRPRDVAAWPFIHLSRTSSVRQYIDAANLPQALPAVLEWRSISWQRSRAGCVRDWASAPFLL